MEYAQDEDEFGGQYPWPSVSRSDADYNGTVGDYWRGGVWLPLAYMSTKALETYGYHDVAHENARRLLAQMSEPIRLSSPTPFGNVILRRQLVPDSGWTVRIWRWWLKTFADGLPGAYFFVY